MLCHEVLRDSYRDVLYCVIKYSKTPIEVYMVMCIIKYTETPTVIVVVCFVSNILRNSLLHRCVVNREVCMII